MDFSHVKILKYLIETNVQCHMNKLTNATGKYERLILTILRKKVRQQLVKTPGKDQIKNTLLLCVDSSFNLKWFDTLFVQFSTGFSETS